MQQSFRLADMIQPEKRRKPIFLETQHPTKVLIDQFEREAMGVVNFWAENIERLRYQAKVLTAKDAEPVEEAEEAIHAEMNLAMIAVTTGLAVAASRVEKWHRNLWQRTVKRKTGVDLEWVLSDLAQSPVTDDFLRWSTSLIRNVNDDVRHQIRTKIALGLARNESWQEIAKELDTVLFKARSRTQLIARDQLSKYAAQLTRARHLEAGVNSYVWSHTGLAKQPRENHVARNGKIFRWDAPPSDGHPGYAINCHCVAVAVIHAR